MRTHNLDLGDSSLESSEDSRLRIFDAQKVIKIHKNMNKGVYEANVKDDTSDKVSCKNER